MITTILLIYGSLAASAVSVFLVLIGICTIVLSRDARNKLSSFEVLSFSLLGVVEILMGIGLGVLIALARLELTL